MKIGLNRKKGTNGLYLRYCLANAGGLSAALILLRMAGALIPTVQILMLATFLNSVQQAFAIGQFTQSLVIGIAMLVGLQILDYLLSTGSAYLSIKHQIRVGTAFELEILEKRSRLPYALLEDSNVCDLIAQVSDEAGEKMHRGFMNLLSLGEYLLRILGICITIFLARAWIGICALLLFLLLIPIVKKGGEEDYASSAKAVAQFRRAAYFRREICGQEHSAERKIFRATDILNAKWKGYYDIGRRISKQGSAKELSRLKLAAILTSLFSCGLAALLTIPLGDGSMSAAIYISLVAAMTNLVQLISWYAAFLLGDFVELRKQAMDISRFLGLEEIYHGSPNGETPDSVKCIEFRNVSFRYPNTERWILHNLSFSMAQGKRYALVGENGAGKSTIVKLLLGLYTDYQGQILLDGRELRTFCPSQLQTLFACAWQYFGKYEMSMADNLLFGQTVSQQELQALLCQLGLEHCAAQLPHGLQTELGRLEERGQDLSGGQWQRIAIARALLRHAAVTITDEPTASLDPSGEVDIYGVIQEYAGEGIQILITHRLGCIRKVDEVLLLSEGRIAERGTHRELVAHGGIYARMYEMQRSWYL